MREEDRVFVGHTGSMPGFLAGLAVEPKRRSGAIVLVNTTAGLKAEELVRKLATKVADAYPPEPEPWQPSVEVPAELEPLLGRWWSEGDEIVIRYRNGRLEAREAAAPPESPPSVFAPDGDDRYRGISGPEEGELLEIVRDGDGKVVKVYWATYPLTRTPQTFGA
jgi:hypothetical protein